MDINRHTMIPYCVFNAERGGIINLLENSERFYLLISTRREAVEEADKANKLSANFTVIYQRREIPRVKVSPSG